MKTDGVCGIILFGTFAPASGIVKSQVLLSLAAEYKNVLIAVD